MDDSWTNPPFGSWRKVLDAWRGLRAAREPSTGRIAEARALLVSAIEDWLAGELSKWLTLLLLCATVVAGLLAVSRLLSP
jgi:hypothetical protein